MAIQVDGYGNITQGNAKEIYTAWKRGEVELNKMQQTKCESFLSPEEMDEVQYDSQVTEKRGKDSINTDGTEKNTTGNAVGTSVGGAVFAAAAVALLKLPIYSNVAGALAGAAGMTVCSAGALACAKKFDNAFKERTAARDESEQSNATMDTYKDSLAETMEMMNDDVEHYNETQKTLTTTVNTQTSQGADLQMQYDAAMAMGDANGAANLKEQMKALSEVDNSQLEDDLKETGEGLEEYRSMNAESLGCADSGQSVSDFLKEGTGLGAVATVNSVLLGVATVLAGVDAGKAAASWKVLFDIPLALAAAVLLVASSVILASATKEMVTKAKNEFECGSAGDDMQDHVNQLNDMIDQQTTYTDDTEGQFAESDEAAAESKGEATEKAGKAVAGNKEGLGNKPKEEKEEPAVA